MPYRAEIRHYLLAFPFMVMGLAGVAFAQTVDLSGIVQEIRGDGYEIVGVERTWLGRIRIEAWDGMLTREVVVSRSTGEILQDATFVGQKTPRFARDVRAPLRETSGGDGSRKGDGAQSGVLSGFPGSGNGGNGGGDDDDDGEDDDDE